MKSMVKFTSLCYIMPLFPASALQAPDISKDETHNNKPVQINSMSKTGANTEVRLSTQVCDRG